MRNLLAVTFLGAGCALAAPGDFDLSFGQAGFALLPAGPLADRANSARFVTTDAGGRVLAIGEAAHPTDGPEGPVRVFARFLPGGVADASLAGTGYLVDQPSLFTGHVGLRAYPVADGKTLLVEQHVALCWPPRAACSLAISTPYLFAQRIDAGGQVDPAYGVMATVSTDTVQQDVAVSPDGSLTIVGHQYPPIAPGIPGPPRFDVRGFDAKGQIYTPWIPTRAAWDCPSAADTAANSAKMARQADGRLLIVQQVATAPGANRLCVSRLNPDATLDESYGVGGRLRIDDARFAGGAATIHALAPRSGGGAVMILEAYSSPFPIARLKYLVWLTAGGELDVSRGTQGVAGPLPLPIHLVEAVAVLPDDRILVAGFPSAIIQKIPFVPLDYARPRILRLDADGQLDRGFGPTGEGYAPLVSLGRGIWPRHIHVGETNEILVAGDAGGGDLLHSSAPLRFAVARLEGDPPPSHRGGIWGSGCGHTRHATPDPTLPALALLAASLLLARRFRRRGRSNRH